MSNILVSNSNLININNTPLPPEIGYYNSIKEDIPQTPDPNNNSYNYLKNK
jgi:hypothetical protein